MKNNTTILGFESLNDWYTTTFGCYSLPVIKFNFFLSILGGLSSIITQYIYNDARAIYFMVMLLLIDFLTGIWRAVKQKKFTSARLPRIFLNLIVYVLMLSLSHNLAIYAPVYNFLPGVLFGGITGTLCFSIFENLSELGFISKSLLTQLKQFKKKRKS